MQNDLTRREHFALSIIQSIITNSDISVHKEYQSSVGVHSRTLLTTNEEHVKLIANLAVLQTDALINALKQKEGA